MSKMIGVVGGMGTYAGIDLLKKIADSTEASKDQDHLPVAMLSYPGRILDRSEYLSGTVDENPGQGMADIVKKLIDTGACIIGIPCNTAHVKEILDPVLDVIPEGCTLVNMLHEVASYIAGSYRDVERVGIMGTNGVYRSRVYDNYMNKSGLETIYPDEDVQYSLVHPAIYDRKYGIKAVSEPVSEKARIDLMSVARMLINDGAQAIVLGCTEIPLAIRDREIELTPVVDANNVLARAMVREAGS